MKKYVSKLGITLAVFLATTAAIAGFQGFNGSSSLGLFTTLKCSTGTTCTKSGGVMTIVATSEDLELENAEAITNSVDDTVVVASNDSDLIFNIYSPKTSNGDATLQLTADAAADNGDVWQIQHDGATNDLLFQNNKTGSQASYFTLTEAGDASLLGTTPYLTIGDADAEDAGIAFDGNAQDFHISLDDSTDDLVIGLGTAAGTTDAIRIDENQDVTIVQNLLGLGTDSLSGFLTKVVAATATTITADQCGSTFINTGAVVINLPNGAAGIIGCTLTFVVGNAANYDINPGGSDQILTLTNAAGDAIRNATKGGSVTLMYGATNEWYVINKEQGTWSDVN